MPDDAACDDGQFCNGVETCDAVSDCQPGTPVDCDDGVGCTVDACNEGTDSCDNTPDDALCDDGQFCNGTEICDVTLDCLAGTPVDCDDTDICTDDSCNEGTDSCDNVFDPTNDPSCLEPVDLDIAKFKPKRVITPSEGNTLKIKLWVVNGGAIAGTASATVVGVQNAVEVYNVTLPVTAPVDGDRVKYNFPSYTPTETGDIQWTATLADGDPDVDEAAATTKVVP
jgi:hypothetical protein